eukprot:IDg541t1
MRAPVIRRTPSERRLPDISPLRRRHSSYTLVFKEARRVARSSSTAELLAAAEALDSAIYLQELFVN